MTTTMKMSRAIGAAAAAAIGLALLAGCGGDPAAVPEVWGTLDTRSLSVGYPENKGYKEQAEADRAEANAAVALKKEGGVRSGMVSVQLDFACSL